jgi:hypothetical protein
MGLDGIRINLDQSALLFDEFGKIIAAKSPLGLFPTIEDGFMSRYGIVWFDMY